MSTDSPLLEKFREKAEGLKFGIVAARFNGEFADALLKGVQSTLETAGVSAEDIETIRVPGSHEVPYAVSMLAETEEYDCLIALGVLIGGDTQHHIMVGTNTGLILQKIAVDSEIPVINGIIVAENREQAEVRCTGAINRGKEFAMAALEMAALNVQLSERLENLDSLSGEFPGGPADGPAIWKS